MPGLNKFAVPAEPQVISADVMRQIMALVSAGLPARQAREICENQISKIPAADLQQFEMVWSQATKLGGPVVMALSRITDVFERRQKNQDEVEISFAGPQATAKLVAWLPLIALLLAQLTGMNPFGAITGSVLGLLSVCLGGGLLVAGHRWSKRLLARALPTSIDPGAFLDCVVIGLQAGLPLPNARHEAALIFFELFEKAPTEQDNFALDEAAELSRTTGAALTEILLANADRFREAHRHQTSHRIARLGVQLMIPLGVAVLPAFILLSIVPIAISLLSSGRL